MADVGETKDSLERVANFDAQSLEQANRLGESYKFSLAVSPAERLISLFQKLPEASLHEFPAPQLDQIKQQADNIYNLFTQVLEFDAKSADAQQKHDQLVGQIKNQYKGVFNQLFPLISYAMARTVDFNELSEKGRIAVQNVRDESQKLIDSLSEQNEQAEQILEEVRNAAAEQGVSQQAKYFANESVVHGKLATKWRDATILTSAIVVGYGIISFFLHKIPLIAPDSIPEAISFTASKLLVFFVLTYLLFLCGRNFLSHRHNQIVNRHRQNALMTYRALVDAGIAPESRDIVLNHAAASIYQLHDTGYTKANSSDATSSTSIVELMPKATMPIRSE